MGQEFFIKSTNLENKVRDLLPSQGGLGAGFDLSASTQIVPIVDLTESAEGSNLRQDLQSSFSLVSITEFNFANSTVDLVTNTGFYRIIGSIFNVTGSTNTGSAKIQITDGVTTKTVFGVNFQASTGTGGIAYPFDFIVYLKAGDILQGVSPKATDVFLGSTRQIADIDGNLVNPA